MAPPQPQNLVFILSDEHNRKIAGCYGHPFVRTPHLDALAARGTRFTAAYCNSPICVPARAALATGRYVHKTRCWDNAIPYHGQMPSWHHALRDAGHRVVSIGKLHFRSSDDDNGFSEEILPMHVLDGIGDLKGLLRDRPGRKARAADLANAAGVGLSDYFKFDRDVANAAVRWIADAAARPDGQPWVLFVSFVMPHFPLIAPPEFYGLYEGYTLDELRRGLASPVPDHPALRQMRATFDYDSHFDDDSRAVALRAYFGMVTALDDNIGRVLTALEAAGLGTTSRVIYTSDHGDNLGNRGMWGKSVLYEDSAAVPLIAVGDGFPVRVEPTPVSLVDIAPTVLAATGVSAPTIESRFDGRSLFDVVQRPDADRLAFSEYHAVNASAGQFMLRRGRWKLIHYVDAPAQLFDLEADPAEERNLAADSAYAVRLAELDAALRRIVDPEAASAQAFADQAAVIRAHGGEDQILASRDIPFTPVPAYERRRSAS